MRKLIALIIIAAFLSCNNSNDNGSISAESTTEANAATPKIDSTRMHAEAILEGRVRPLDDQPTFNVMDSMRSKDSSTRAFYFSAFRKIAQQSDGALTEIVIEQLLEFVSEYPKDFLRTYRKMTHNERKMMTGFLGYEFYMNDNALQKAMDEYFEKVKTNCIDCTESDQVILQQVRKAILDTVLVLRVENAG